MKKTKNLTHVSMVVLGSALSGSLLSAASYDWSMDDTQASWGVIAGGGSYDRAADISPAPMHSYHQTANHGPYDGEAGVLRASGTVGTSTRSDPNSIFDLSTVGDTATIRTLIPYVVTSGDSGGRAHLWQFGLSNNSSWLGDTGNESLVIAADFQGFTSSPLAHTMDIGLYDHNDLDNAPTDGTWTAAESVSLIDGYNIETAAAYFSQNKIQFVEMTYENVGGGNLSLSSSVWEVDVTGLEASDTITGASNVVSSTDVVANPFTDMSTLRPAFGYSNNDSNLPYTGSNFDWEQDVNAFIGSVPEPSSSLLIMASGLLLLLRRKAR